MGKLKNILSVVIALASSIMIFSTWPSGEATAWVVALVGWIEVISYQRKEEF